MGKRRQRLIVQADITSEEDEGFLQWVKALRRRRRIGEAIRQGLWLRYGQAIGRTTPAPFMEVSLAPVAPGQVEIRPAPVDQTQVADRLKNLVQGF